MSKEGSAIKALRESRGLTQTKLAEESGVPYYKISYYESGQRPVPLWISEIFAEYFGVNVADITDAKPYEFKYDMTTYSGGQVISKLMTNNKKEAKAYYKRNADFNATRIIYCGQKLTYLQGDAMMKYTFQGSAAALCVRRNTKKEEK